MKGNTGNQKREIADLTFTVAECGEYHSLGKFYRDIRTLEEAIHIYRQIPPERMNSSPSIGINLHVRGKDRMEDIQADILSGDEIDIDYINLIPELSNNPQVQETIKEIMEKFPDKRLLIIKEIG